MMELRDSLVENRAEARYEFAAEKRKLQELVVEHAQGKLARLERTYEKHF